ncbi:LOW QUALITY PROTEIN: uncharacterized protein LOC121383816 [Gigantopelta aegis]|uniref:LOW QUALITY PROTEIN: uncharacterized protein LOC121383816 n=1 Tax=Gigantopelta aegis TaxID=1735272 RepID=UPI001B88A80E|nr:LOW QUALITY PROTEIN: uncharacterized protein LOC121383816 [Gigantopelta aegis]
MACCKSILVKSKSKQETSTSPFLEEVLKAHNQYRTTHVVAPLALNKEMSALALKWANNLVETNSFKHSGTSYNGKTLGENIAIKWSSTPVEYTGQEITDQWYSESRNYTYGNQYQPDCGHFTQVVWKGSAELGVGIAKNEDGRTIVVANYSYPAGNTRFGEFEGGVASAALPPLPRLTYSHVLQIKTPRSSHSVSRKSGLLVPMNPSRVLALQKDTRVFYGSGAPLHGDVFSNGLPVKAAVAVLEQVGGCKSVSPLLRMRRQVFVVRQRRHLVESPKTTMANKQFVDDLMKAHNEYRAIHQVPPLVENDDLNELAQKWANQLANSNMFVHSQSNFKGSKVGENIAMKMTSSQEEYSGQEVTDQWYNEVQMYRFGGRRYSGLFMCSEYDNNIFPRIKSVDVNKSTTTALSVPSGTSSNLNKESSAEVLKVSGARSNSTDISIKSGRSQSTECANNSNNNSCIKVPALMICTGGSLKEIGSDSLEDMSRLGDKHKLKTPFVDSLLKMHNKLRARHDAPVLMHSDELSKYAQEWAEFLAHMDQIKHSPCTLKGQRLGENIACKFDMAGFVDYSAKEVALQWYSEHLNYDFSTHKGTNAGQFTQMVWKSTRHMGVGKAKSPEGKVVVVASYRPPGNVVGQYEENVAPPNEDIPEEGIKAILSTSKTAVTGCMSMLRKFGMDKKA